MSMLPLSVLEAIMFLGLHDVCDSILLSVCHVVPNLLRCLHEICAYQSGSGFTAVRRELVPSGY